MLHTKLKFTEQMNEYFSQQFIEMAGDTVHFTYENYKVIKEEDPEFLSIIEDIEELSLDNAKINEKHGEQTFTRA